MMEHRGTLLSWNDQKGFGFIEPEDGSERVFVHISAMRGDSRPQAGGTVLFTRGADAQGRPRAEHMRANGLSLDRPAIRRKPKASSRKPPVQPARARPSAVKQQRTESRRGRLGVQNLPAKLALFFALLTLPGIGSAQMLAIGSIWPLAGYLLISLVSFLMYWSDKQKALKGRWRTPENSLHLVELLGGWPGALIAQQLLRHKTRKTSYQTAFWLIVGLHQLFWIDWVVLGGRYLGYLVRPLLG